MNLDFVTLNYATSIDETLFTISLHIGNYKVNVVIPHGATPKEVAKLLKKASKNIKSIHQQTLTDMSDCCDRREK